jgi:hypothetical protein
MSGKSRFAVHVDTGTSVIRSADNLVASSRINVNSTSIRVANTIPGLTAGSLICIDKNEVVVVDEIQQVLMPNGSYQYNLLLDEGTVSPYAQGTPIDVIAFPAIVRRACVPGSTSIYLDTMFDIIPGDSFFMLSRPELILVMSPKTEISAASVDMNINASLKRWNVECDPCYTDIPADSVIYIEANVGYMSKKTQLTDMSGPYIADIFSGKTLGDTKEDVRICMSFDGAVPLTSNVSTNEVAVSLPVRAGDLCLWSFEHGSATFISYDECLIKLDEKGRAGFAVELPVAAQMILEFEVDGASRLWTEHDNVVIESDPATMKVDHTSKIIKICCTGIPLSNVRIKTNPLRLNYRSVTYSYVSKLKSGESWTGGGLVLKPLLRQARDLSAVSDDGDYLTINTAGFLL